jgi:hypothetical protein
MTHAMQPELYHVGQWKAGQAPIIDSCLVVVTHDQTSHAYVIGKDQYEQFCEWVCGEWVDEYDAECDEWVNIYDVECDNPDDFMAEHDIQIKRTNLEDV